MVVPAVKDSAVTSVSMARKPLAISLLILLEPDLWGVFNDWFLCEIAQEEKDILLFQQ